MGSPRILVVDDDPSQLAALKRALRRSRFEVDTAASGRAGLRMALQNPPDLVLLDVSMPCMSGHEFLRRLRRLESRGRLSAGSHSSTQACPNIPVIFLTALDSPHQCASGLAVGAADYVTKPFEPDELRARIRSQLRQAHLQREALASKEAELMSLNLSITAALEAARECQEELTHLAGCLGEVGHADHADEQQNLVTRAKEDIQNLTQSLSSITEWLAVKGTQR